MKGKSVLVVLVVALPVLLGVAKCTVTTPNHYYDVNGNYVQVTDPEGQCVLYRVLDGVTAAKVVERGLFVVNYAALRSGYYTAADAVRELDLLEAEVLRQGATVGSVITLLGTVAARAGTVVQREIVLVTEGLVPYKDDRTALDQCTRYKLVNYIGGQRSLALAFAGEI